MTDAPIEVRLCQCGKNAGHTTVCNRDENDPDGIRVDSKTEDEYAQRRAERFLKRARQFAEQRRERRAGTDTLQLHREAIERAMTLSAVGGSSVGRSSPSSESQRVGPPRPQLLDDDPRWREHWTVIRSRLERVHELLDEQEGHGTVAATNLMLGAEKDKLILHPSNRGLRAQAVVDKLGSEIAGSVETVRRVRRANSLDHLGNERPDDNRRTDG